MKVKQISDSTLKITIKLEDLEDRGMELSDFLVPQEKTEEFFYAVLDELELPLTFRESGMLSFRVTPKPDKIDIFVTKSDLEQPLDFNDFSDFPDFEEVARMSPEEFLKSLEKTLKERSQADEKAVRRLETTEKEDLEETEELEDKTDQPYVYFTFCFKELKEAIAFSKVVDIAVETSELYKLSGAYYMTILIDVEDRLRDYPIYLCARMIEHAEDSNHCRPYLQEHGRLLLESKAVETLRKVSLA